MAINKFIKNYLNLRFNTFSAIEVIFSISLALMIIIPAHIYISKELLGCIEVYENQSISNNLKYVLDQINDEFYTSGFSSTDFRPLNNETGTLIQFKKFDGKLVRYYKMGREIVKDYNYTTYNAITPKIISEFYVKRFDINENVFINLKIVGQNGEVATKTIMKGKNN